ncbi:choice-of-anchor Q domain-containing protein [Planctomycetota bacterium]
MSRIKLLGAVLLYLVYMGTARAEIFHMPAEFSDIQSAIDAAATGDTIIVAPGEYLGTINFSGKDLVLTSEDPNDPNIVATTVLYVKRVRGIRDQSVVSFLKGETRAAVLSGFTIKGGVGTYYSDFEGSLGGGVLCFEASPTIIHNVITENSMSLNPDIDSYGGGVFCIFSDALVAFNTIRENQASGGGGLLTAYGDPMVYGNIIAENRAFLAGGAFVLAGTYLNNTFVGNRATGIAGAMFAAYEELPGVQITSGLHVHNNIFAHSPTGWGILAEGLSYESGWFTHNNVFGNLPDNYVDELESGFTLSETVVEEMALLSTDPCFVDANAYDYTLLEGSPCIDAGRPDFVSPLGIMDMIGGQRPYGAHVDIGALEAQSCISPRANAGPDQTVSVGERVTLDGSASQFCDPDAVHMFVWAPAPGTIAQLDNRLAMQPTFTPQAEGEYGFRLVVREGMSLSEVDEVIITVVAAPQ